MSSSDVNPDKEGQAGGLNFSDPWWTVTRFSAWLLRVQGRSRVEVSEALGVPRNTLKDWEAHPSFVAAVQQLLQQVAREGVAELFARKKRCDELMDEALVMLELKLDAALAKPSGIEVKDVVALVKQCAALVKDAHIQARELLPETAAVVPARPPQLPEQPKADQPLRPDEPASDPGNWGTPAAPAHARRTAGGSPARSAEDEQTASQPAEPASEPLTVDAAPASLWRAPEPETSGPFEARTLPAPESSGEAGGGTIYGQPRVSMPPGRGKKR